MNFSIRNMGVGFFYVLPEIVGYNRIRHSRNLNIAYRQRFQPALHAVYAQRTEINKVENFVCIYVVSVKQVLNGVYGK